MANEKIFQSRIQLKHDIEENWSKATNFIPKVGEIIIYDIDENNSIARFKIGDGITNINSLPFVSHHEAISYLPQELTEEQKKQARENIGAGKPQIQADWNQSDETALDYIKNRTHYDDTIYTLRTKQDIANILNDMGINYGSSTTEIIPGITFRIIIDGVVYDNVPIWGGCYCAGSYTWGIGDGYSTSPSGQIWYSTDYGFCIYGYGDSLIPNRDIFPNGIESFEVYTIEKDFKYLDPKFIKDMYYEGEVTVFDEQTISGFAVMNDPIYAVEMENILSPEEGKECTVEWDGVAYDVVWKAAPDAPLIYAGNENYVNMTSGGDIPFAIMVVPAVNLMFFVTESTAESHTVCVKEIGIHYIDPKYIKDMYYDGTKKVDISGATYTISGVTLSNLTVTHEPIPLELGQVWQMRQMHYSGSWTDAVEEIVKQDEDGTLYIGSLEGNYLTKTELTLMSGTVQQGFDTVEITCVSGYATQVEIKQLDEKYLPILEEAYETVFETEEISRGPEIYVGTFDRLVGKYRVTFDGESNIVEFIDVPSEGVSFYEGENYVIETFEGNIFFGCSDNETHSLRIEKVKNVVKSEYLPDEAKAQADWNQNDETAVDYIKNRTHYEGEIISTVSINYTATSETRIEGKTTEESFDAVGKYYNMEFDSIIVDGTEYQIKPISTPSMGYFYFKEINDTFTGFMRHTVGWETYIEFAENTFITGNTYIIKLKMESTEFIKQLDEKYLPVFENPVEIIFEKDAFESRTTFSDPKFKKLIGKYKVTLDNNTEIIEFVDNKNGTESTASYGDVYSITTQNGSISYWHNDYGTHSLKIETRNTFKKEHFPDEIFTQADWAQNNQSEADYINNKPFGGDSWEIVATITGTGNYDGTLTFEMTEPKWQSAITTVGTVIAYNDERYTVIRSDIGTGNVCTALGEGMRFEGRGAGTGFNWTLHLDNVSFTEGEEYAFSVLQYVELKQIDEKYIPDTIMRTPSEDDALELVAELGIAEPMTDDEGNVLTDENGALFTL